MASRRGRIVFPTRVGLKAFLALGLVSLLADAAYEGGRSSLGPLMYILGASMLAISLAVYGELASYLARVVSGLLASVKPSKSIYISLLFLGYGLNTAIPLMALAGSWEAVLALFIVERFGKGLRAPIRDTLVAELGSKGVHGKLFGLYELLDQVGAVIGPLLIAYYSVTAGLRRAYAVLAVPVALSLVVLAYAVTVYPWRPRVVQEGGGVSSGKAVAYGVIAALPYLALIHWVPLSGIIYARHPGTEAGELIPILYSIAMASDAVAAPALGALYDRLGYRSHIVSAVIGAIASILFMYSARVEDLILSALLWGVAMGSLETMPRAYIATRVDGRLRPAAYAAFHIASGLFWGLTATIAQLIPQTLTPLYLAAAAAIASIAILLA